MPTIAEVRTQYPQYHDMSDDDLASALHQKFYADMPEDQFRTKIGMPAAAPPAADTAPSAGEPGLAGTVDAYGRAIAKAVTFGFNDEIGAGLDAAGSHIFPWRDPKTYDQALADTRGSDEAVADAHPIADVAGTLTGAVGSGTLAAKAAPETAAMVGRLVSAPASSVGQVATGLGVGVAGGAAQGAISGFGDGEGGFVNRADNALASAGVGALAGGAVGAVVPAVAPLIGKAANSFLDSVSVNRMAKAAGMSGPSANILNDALQADSAFAGRGASNLAAAGSDAMLADAGSATKGILDLAIQKGGAGANLAKDAVEARAGRANTTLNGALDDILGAPDGLRLPSREGAPDLGKLYDKAYATPIDYSHPAAMEMEQMVSDRVPPEAIKAANALMRTEGNSSKQIMAKFNDDGSVTFVKQPDVRQLDYITRGLNQVAQEADGKGKLGGTTPVGRAYGQLAKNIRGNLKELVPEYGDALNQAGTEIGKKEARDFGYDMMAPGVRRSDVSEFANGLSDVDRTQAMAGIRQHLDDKMANVTRAMTDTNMDAREAVKGIKDLSSRASIEKMTHIIGPSNAFKLAAQVNQASKSLELRAAVAENSKTFARQNAERIVKQQIEPGPIGKLAQGEVWDAPKSALRILTNQTPADQIVKERGIYTEIANALTGSRGEDAQKLLGTLQAIHAKQPQNQELAKLIQQVSGLGAAGAGYEGIKGVVGQAAGVK